MKPWISRFSGLFAAFALGSALAADGVHIRYSEPLSGLHIERIAAGINDVSATERLGFDAFGRRFALELADNRRLLDSLGRHALAPGVGVYRGRLEGAPGSWLRVVVVDGEPAGLLFDGREYFAIERPPGAGAPVIFRLADLQLDPAVLGCASAATTGGGMLDALQSGLAKSSALAPGATQEIDLAILGDADFGDDHVDAAAALVTRMNVVDGIFSEQLGVQLNLNLVQVFDATNEPFSDTTSAGDLLDELTAYRGATPAQQDNGLSHLFTGRELDGSTIGIAYTGALCSRNFGTGLTQGTSGVTTDSLVAAHELGHNFGSPHDGESGSACEATAQNFLMAPRLNGSDTFSACSIEQMQDDIARASCITALPTTDVAAGPGAVPGNALLGDAATVEFDVDGIGTETANDVSVTISVPVQLGLQSASATAGSCTTGAGSVDCALGSIASGSGATVSVVVGADAVGSFEFAATATAAGDTNAANDGAVQTLTVDPAVDLSVAAPDLAQLGVDQAATLRPTVSNLATIAASDLVLTVVPGAGLRIDGATLPGGACTSDAGSATCDLASLAAGASATLEVGVTGVAVGARSYTVEVSATEPDRDAANNAATGQVTVTDTAGGGSGGGGAGSSGGGHASWLLLPLLAALARRRRATALH